MKDLGVLTFPLAVAGRHRRRRRIVIEPERPQVRLPTRLCDGLPMESVPAEFGSGSSLHRYFQEYARRGVFHKLWKYLLRRYDELRGIRWKWQSLDGSMTKAPLGGEENREKPYGSWEVGREAVAADRCTRGPAGRRHRWRQCR